MSGSKRCPNPGLKRDNVPLQRRQVTSRTSRKTLYGRCATGLLDRRDR
ncbi:MAG: hypothetical protein HC840_24680 [Leptolyngbyaceae cyanobacterium RM2_2_4]|nr:hypothetical protein [Leptolyngbyaceae cyanobacterium RM2_2_4]